MYILTAVKLIYGTSHRILKFILEARGHKNLLHLILDFICKKIGEMARLGEIKSYIEKLSPEEFQKLKEWIHERDWELWDKQIEKDSNSGKLNFLIEQAEKDLRRDELEDL